MSYNPDSGLGGYHAPVDAYEPAGPGPVNTPDFNPFAALGLDPATATAAQLRPAYRRAMRHRHGDVLIRLPATATAFPSQVQVQLAYEYLEAPARLATAAYAWRNRHHTVFRPELAVGATGVFASTRGGAARATPSTGARTRGGAARATPSARQARPAPGSSADTAVELDASPSPEPAPAPRPAARRPPRPRAATAAASVPIILDDDDDDDEDDEDDDEVEIVSVYTPTPGRTPSRALARAPRAGPVARAATGQATA